MQTVTRSGRLLIAVTALAAMVAVSQEGYLYAQTEQSGQDVPAARNERAADPLDARQDNVARRYVRFEKTLLQMAEYMRKTEPERAELLVRAIARSKENRIAHEMQQVVDLLKNEQYGEALERETQLVGHLKSLLELLQSEDRKSEIDEEKRRILDLLKDVGKLIGKQKGVRAATERGGEPGRLSDRQQNVADDTERLVDKIDRQDAKRNADADSEENENGDSQQSDSPEQTPGDSDSQKGDSKEQGDSQDSQPSDGKPGEGQPGQGKPGQGKPGQAQPGEGQPGEGRPGESQPGGEPSNSDSPQNSTPPGEQNRTPGRDDIEQAKREMQQALERLENQDRRGASDRQDEAVMQLQRAKEKLEEILRQLREEEMELLLAALEARFQKMLAEQWLVYNSTVSLDKTPKPEWTSRHFGRTRELAQTESEIALEAAKALMLLKEEGSSVAFPEAVEQLHQDMLTVTRRLERTEVGQLTQTIERDIIESLEELIEALQREMEKQKEQQRGPMPPSGQPQDKPLVDTLAELKMLRTLQLRVNRRTRRLGSLVDADQASDPDVVEQLRELSGRQARIQEATNDLATGKNK